MTLNHKIYVGIPNIHATLLSSRNIFMLHECKHTLYIETTEQNWKSFSMLFTLHQSTIWFWAISKMFSLEEKTEIILILWGHLKNEVYRDIPTTQKKTCEKEFGVHAPQSLLLESVKQSFIYRIRKCMEVNGSHFKHFL